MEDDYPGCGNFIKEGLKLKSVPVEAAEIMLSSLTDSSKKQYDIGLRKWWDFCQRSTIDPFRGSIPDILAFLTKEYKNGASYGTLNCARSAIALIYGPNLGIDPQIKRFFQRNRSIEVS